MSCFKWWPYPNFTYSRMWVRLQMLLKSCWWLTGCEQHWKCLWMAVSSDLFLWPTAGEWHWTFCERKSHLVLPQQVFSNDQQLVSDIVHFVKGSLIQLFLWPTESEWHCTFCGRQSHHIFSYDQQRVSDIAHSVKGNPITSLWPTACEWHCIFCVRQSHQVFSYDQQKVSGIAHFVKGSLIRTFPVAKSLWVTLHIL